MPKSASFTTPWRSIMMLVGLMSRCRTRFSWANSSARATESSTCAHSSQVSLPPSTRASSSARLSPSTYSMTMYAYAPSDSKSKTVTMLGCPSMHAVRASARASSAVVVAASSRMGSRLMATRRWRRRSQQVHTVPKPPVPRRARTRYLPRRISSRGDVCCCAARGASAGSLTASPSFALRAAVSCWDILPQPRPPRPASKTCREKHLAGCGACARMTSARGRGGIGRRVRFRSVWGQLHEGSSPFARTMHDQPRFSPGLFCARPRAPAGSSRPCPPSRRD